MNERQNKFAVTSIDVLRFRILVNSTKRVAFVICTHYFTDEAISDAVFCRSILMEQEEHFKQKNVRILSLLHALFVRYNFSYIAW